MKTWETLAKDFFKVWQQMKVETPIADAMRKRNEEYRKRMQELADQVQRNAQAEYDALIAAIKQPEPKECSSTLKPKVEECEHVYSAVAGQNRHMCFKCGYKRNPKDTITIDGCEYTAEQFFAVVGEYFTYCPNAILSEFKSALQKVSDKGGV